jgi:hypothetical protein
MTAQQPKTQMERILDRIYDNYVKWKAECDAERLKKGAE